MKIDVRLRVVAAIAIAGMLMAGALWANESFVRGGHRVGAGQPLEVPLEAGSYALYVEFARPPARTYGDELGPEAGRARVEIRRAGTGQAVHVTRSASDGGHYGSSFVIHRIGRVELAEAGAYTVAFEPGPPGRARALVLREAQGNWLFLALVGLLFAFGIGFVFAIRPWMRRLRAAS